MNEIPTLAMSIPQFCVAIGINRRTYYRHVKAGLLPPPLKQGRRSLIAYDDAQAHIERLKAAQRGQKCS